MANVSAALSADVQLNRPAPAGLEAFSAEQRAALADDDSRAFRTVCEVLVSVICAGLAMMVFTVWWIIS